MNRLTITFAGLAGAAVSIASVASGPFPGSAAGAEILRPVVVATGTFVRDSGLPEATGGTAYVWPMAVRFVGKHERTYSGDKGAIGRLHAWGEAGGLSDNPDSLIRE